MYTQYFGLREPVFSITPDPVFLYLSPQHREALAHLLYGVSAGGGFVLLTGEVGTGKTTLCRAFLEQLPGDVDLALVLNPNLSVVELLKTVCREFGIEVGVSESSVKDLVDRLNQSLLRAHSEGRRSILLIDEAQNLSAEVLEEIRLLTNLETDKRKLLQIFLVGQPELRDLLGQSRLRQLAQRITARFHLRPLGAWETGEYVRHRLAVAGVERRLFSRAALRRLHRLSGGVPRLINNLCDRALLGAYARRRQQVGWRMIGQAARELAGEYPSGGPPLLRFLAIAFALGMMGVGLFWGMDHGPLLNTLSWDRWGAWIRQLGVPAGPETVAPGEAPSESLRDLPKEPVRGERDIGTLVLSANQGRQGLLELWGVKPVTEVEADLCAQAAATGLICRELRGTWNNLRQYALPALLPMYRQGKNAGLVLVVGLGRLQVTLETPGGRQSLPISELEPYWLGDYQLLWRPPEGLRTIGPRSPSRALVWLRSALQRLGGGAQGGETPMNDHFDAELKTALAAFQEANGLQADGIAGPETLMRLQAALREPGIPFIIREAD